MTTSFYHGLRSSSFMLRQVLNPSPLRLKLQVGVAGLLLLIALGVAGRDRFVMETRDSAYQRILTAQQQQDDLAVVENAEIFFANAPLSGKDDRNQQVMDLYAESFVRWFAQQEQPSDSAVQARIDRYRAASRTVPGEKP
jgi:site-specific recombinase